MKNRFLLCALFILASLALNFYYKNYLPECIPLHFNPQGLPDGYGSKSQALILSSAMMILVSGLYLLSIYLTQNPNYWTRKLKKRVSESGLKLLIAHSLQLIDWMMILALILFLYLQEQSLMIALGRQKRLGNSLWIILGLEFLGMVFFVIRMLKTQRQVEREALIGNSPTSI